MIRALITIGILSAIVGCTPMPDASATSVITLPKTNGKVPARYEKSQVRVYFAAKGAYRALSGIACEIKGKKVRIKFTAPQNFNVPVYADRPLSYRVTCQMELGASIRVAEGGIEPKDAENAPTYDPVSIISFSN